MERNAIISTVPQKYIKFSIGTQLHGNSNPYFCKQMVLSWAKYKNCSFCQEIREYKCTDQK